MIKTERNGHYIEWDIECHGGEIVDDYYFEIWWGLSPICGFEPILDDQGQVVRIDGAIGPLSYTHTLNQYDFNQVHYYKIYAYLKIPWHGWSVSESASASASPSFPPPGSEPEYQQQRFTDDSPTFRYVEVIKTERNFHYIEWDINCVSPFTVDDYIFRISWSIAPICGFEPILNPDGTILEIDGATGPLSYIHELAQYDFNQVHYYKVYAILK